MSSQLQRASARCVPVNYNDPDGHHLACDNPAECKAANAYYASKTNRRGEEALYEMPAPTPTSVTDVSTPSQIARALYECGDADLLGLESAHQQAVAALADCGGGGVKLTRSDILTLVEAIETDRQVNGLALQALQGIAGALEAYLAPAAAVAVIGAVTVFTGGTGDAAAGDGLISVLDELTETSVGTTETGTEAGTETETELQKLDDFRSGAENLAKTFDEFRGINPDEYGTTTVEPGTPEIEPQPTLGNSPFPLESAAIATVVLARGLWWLANR